MRIIKELTIEDIHIAIFKIEQKFTLKLQWNRLEQVFKLDSREGIEELNHVLALIDKIFVEKAKSTFESMLSTKNDRLAALQDIMGEEFPDII